MRVLFVSGIDGFCHRYQVLHRAAQLVALGASATVRHFADPRLPHELAAHDVLFAYRVPETAAFRALLERAADLGIPRIAAIDDLIFIDDPRALPLLDDLSADERSRWRDGVRRYRATIAACDAFVAPTEPLVAAGDAQGWRSHLHRNALAPAELEIARRARRAAAEVERPAPVLGYFSGTATHDEDFASIARALRDVLREHPRVRLMIVGPLHLPAELAPLAERIERRPLVPWHELLAAISATDVCLAPLSTERPFALAKGEIKYLEAAAVGVPTVASATSAYRHAILDGENGRLATTQDEWRRALDELLRDAALRRRLGASALADVGARWTEPARARELLAIVDDVRGGLRRVQTLGLTAETFDVEPSARVALEPDACPAFPAGAAAAVSPPLPVGGRVAQRVRVALCGLARIDLHTVTYGQEIRARLRLALRSVDGTLLAEALLPAAEAPDRGWLALELDAPLGDSAGRTYVVELSAEGDGAGGALSFGVTGTAPRDDDGFGALGAACLDGAPLAGALVLRGFAAWAEALRDDPHDGPRASGSAPGAAAARRTGDGSPAAAGACRT